MRSFTLAAMTSLLVCGLGAVGREVTLLVSLVVAMLLMDASSVFEWPCCVCSQTRLGPGPRQQGWQVQEVGFPTRNEVEGGRRPVCTSAARKIGVPLARARDGVPQQAWLPWLCAERMNALGALRGVPAVGVTEEWAGSLRRRTLQAPCAGSGRKRRLRQ